MKKFVFTLVLIACTALAVSAQPKAIGGRIGYGLEASYQHNVGSNFIEADMGLGLLPSGLSISCVYDFVIARPDWTNKGEWGFYAGPGVSVSFANYFAFGIGGQVGLEYIFESVPLQLAVDYRPVFGPVLGNGFWVGGVSSIALSARYCF